MLPPTVMVVSPPDSMLRLTSSVCSAWPETRWLMVTKIWSGWPPPFLTVRDCPASSSLKLAGVLGEPATQVERCFLLTLGREPAAAERRSATEFLANSSDPEPLATLCLALFNLNEFMWVD